ncbi:SDR family NAD(P)-dependent oxidoreductase [Flammeovirgaceae bacterium SG7u.111]|nr:SDR family NAD(P)-dependent oxidoreductase [Flammeovirgaceae bacterium SG7u.132]WPO37425.1 SDR family NAD(P)-dependent oxidoreductase [Flammeovirgaceae bacterium SG7u.111]
MKKTILITGSTDGIGKLTAIKFAKEGHDVYLHGRNPKKLSDAISEVKSLSKNDNIKGFVADFSALDSVRKLARQIIKELPKIDVLINNAGVFKSSSPFNKDGLDMRIVVNYLAPYLLTKELIPLLNKGIEPRILNLSSAAQSSVDYDVLSGKKQEHEQEAYAQSKLALTMWSFYLAEKVQNIAVIAVNPGSLLNTKMVMEAYGNSWSSADKGANILFDLAISDDYKNMTGAYYDNDTKGFEAAHSDAYDEVKIETLIKVTTSMLTA